MRGCFALLCYLMWLFYGGHYRKSIRPNTWLLFKSTFIANLQHNNNKYNFAPRRVRIGHNLNSWWWATTNIIAAKQPRVLRDVWPIHDPHGNQFDSLRAEPTWNFQVAARSPRMRIPTIPTACFLATPVCYHVSNATI